MPSMNGPGWPPYEQQVYPRQGTGIPSQEQEAECIVDYSPLNEAPDSSILTAWQPDVFQPTSHLEQNLHLPISHLPWAEQDQGIVPADRIHPGAGSQNQSPGNFWYGLGPTASQPTSPFREQLPSQETRWDYHGANQSGLYRPSDPMGSASAGNHQSCFQSSEALTRQSSEYSIAQVGPHFNSALTRENHISSTKPKRDPHSKDLDHISLAVCSLWINRFPGQLPDNRVLKALNVAFDSSKSALRSWFRTYVIPDQGETLCVEEQATADEVCRSLCKLWTDKNLQAIPDNFELYALAHAFRYPDRMLRDAFVRQFEKDSAYNTAATSSDEDYLNAARSHCSLDSNASTTRRSSQLSDWSKPFFCTFGCKGRDFKKKSSWRRHEQESHCPEYGWFCPLLPCPPGKNLKRLEHLRKHLRKHHSEIQMTEDLIRSCRGSIVSDFDHHCNLIVCNVRFETWPERIDHVSTHFTAHRDKSQWRVSEDRTQDHDSGSEATVIEEDGPNDSDGDQGPPSRRPSNNDFSDAVGKGSDSHGSTTGGGSQSYQTSNQYNMTRRDAFNPHDSLSSSTAPILLMELHVKMPTSCEALTNEDTNQSTVVFKIILYRPNASHWHDMNAKALLQPEKSRNCSSSLPIRPFTDRYDAVIPPLSIGQDHEGWLSHDDDNDVSGSKTPLVPPSLCSSGCQKVTMPELHFSDPSSSHDQTCNKQVVLAAPIVVKNSSNTTQAVTSKDNLTIDCVGWSSGQGENEVMFDCTLLHFKMALEEYFRHTLVLPEESDMSPESQPSYSSERSGSASSCSTLSHDSLDLVGDQAHPTTDLLPDAVAEGLLEESMTEVA